MTIANLVQILTKQEDGKSKVKIGDMREIIAALSDQIFYEFEVLGYVETPKVPSLKALYLNGKKRAKKEKSPEPILEA